MSFLKKIFGKKKNEQVSISKTALYLPDFDKYNEFGQIIVIFDYVFNPDFVVANKASEKINQLFKSVQIFNNKQFYETFKYLKINKSDIKKFARFNKEIEVTLLSIASMNGNGYVREEALKRLIELQTQNTIPFILFRTADWVAPIRKTAETAIQKFLVTDNTIFFIQNHKLISWLLQVQRADLSKLYGQIIDLVTQKRLTLEQLEKLNESDRFFYFKLLAKKDLLDSELVSQMQADKYYLIRFLLIKHFNKVVNKKAVLIKLLTDKSQKVRQGAVNLIASQKLNEYETILRDLIFDSSTSVRIEARRLLNKISDCDFTKIYQESLSDKKKIIGAILGLSEVADKNKISLIQKYLDSTRAKIRTASLIGVYNLDSNLGIEKAYQILETENAISTRRAAGYLLSKQSINLKRLRNLYDLTDTTGKKIILQFFNRYGGWSVAGDFLKALTDNDKNIQLMGRIFLESWENYSIRLATKQNQEDKDYVLHWYKRTNNMGIKVSENILHIFRNKETSSGKEI